MRMGEAKPATKKLETKKEPAEKLGRGRGLPLPALAHERLRAMVDASTAEAVAAELGVSATTVLRGYARLGLKRRIRLALAARLGVNVEVSR